MSLDLFTLVHILISLLVFFRDRGRFSRTESEIDRNTVEELAWQLNLTDPKWLLVTRLLGLGDC